MKTTYEQQAEKFLSDTNSELKIEFLKYDYHFQDDKEKRDIYKCTLSRGQRSYSFNFGQSINKSGYRYKYGRSIKHFDLPSNKFERERCLNNKTYLRSWVKSHIQYDLQQCDIIMIPEKPTSYDILACLQKYDPYTFENFCSEFGYDEDSRKAEKIYQAVKDEYNNLAMLYSDSELELMAEIQ